MPTHAHTMMRFASTGSDLICTSVLLWEVAKLEGTLQDESAMKEAALEQAACTEGRMLLSLASSGSIIASLSLCTLTREQAMYAPNYRALIQ